MRIILWLLIGALAGWLAGTFMKGSGFGVLGNIVLGIVGAMVGGFIFRFLGLAAVGWVGSLITATVGAVAVLALAKLIKQG
jgi:uncharacterized membrane protein YeaQ/YmgE (transglycosylase-associated protein family)